MKRAGWILLLALSAWGTGAAAQAGCAVSLPYADGEFPDCTPRSAAAYDFAFCSVSYHIIALAAPESDKALGEKGRSAAFRRKGTDYAMIAAALSSNETLQKNVALAQKYYDSLNGKENVYIRLTIDTIGLKCDAVESHHSEALDELAQAARAKPRPGR